MTVHKPVPRTASKPQRKKAELLAQERNPLLLSLEDNEINLIKSLHRGTASGEQQKQAFAVIIQKICKIGSVSFNSDPIIMAFNEGMRMVGSHLLEIASQPYDKLIKEK